MEQAKHKKSLGVITRSKAMGKTAETNLSNNTSIGKKKSYISQELETLNINWIPI